MPVDVLFRHLLLSLLPFGGHESNSLFSLPSHHTLFSCVWWDSPNQRAKQLPKPIFQNCCCWSRPYLITFPYFLITVYILYVTNTIKLITSSFKSNPIANCHRQSWCYFHDSPTFQNSFLLLYISTFFSCF